DRAAQCRIAAVNDELVRRTHAALGRRSLERLAEQDGQYKDRVAYHAGKLRHDNASASILASLNQCEAVAGGCRGAKGTARRSIICGTEEKLIHTCESPVPAGKRTFFSVAALSIAPHDFTTIIVPVIFG